MESFVREKSSGAIINTSKNSLKRYKETREVRRQKSKKIDDLHERLLKLEKLVTEMVKEK